MGFGSILSGAGSLISAASGIAGLFGNKQKGPKYEVARNQAYKDYDKSIQAITDSAKKYGFHPLALLGSNPGSYGFAAAVPPSNNQFGIGDAVGQSLSAFGDLYQSEQDRETYRQEGIRERALNNLRGKEITPEVRLQRENMQLQNELLRADIATSRSKLAGLRAGITGATPPVRKLVGPGGITITPDAGRTTAQDAEDQYGEAGDIAFGLGGLIDDLVNNRIASARIQNPLTAISPGVWFDVPAFIREQRKKYGF